MISQNQKKEAKRTSHRIIHKVPLYSFPVHEDLITRKDGYGLWVPVAYSEGELLVNHKLLGQLARIAWYSQLLTSQADWNLSTSVDSPSMINQCFSVLCKPKISCWINLSVPSYLLSLYHFCWRVASMKPKKKKMLVLSFLMSQSCLENASPGSIWEYATMYTEATYSLCHFLTFSCCGIFLKRKPYIKRTISSLENRIWQTKSVSSNLVSLQMQNCSSHNSQTCGLIAAWQIWKLSFQIKSNQTKLNLYYCHRPA